MTRGKKWAVCKWLLAAENRWARRFEDGGDTCALYKARVLGAGMGDSLTVSGGLDLGRYEGNN
jgi:hypothetical protein